MKKKWVERLWGEKELVLEKLRHQCGWSIVRKGVWYEVRLDTGLTLLGRRYYLEGRKLKLRRSNINV